MYFKGLVTASLNEHNAYGLRGLRSLCAYMITRCFTDPGITSLQV